MWNRSFWNVHRQEIVRVARIVAFKVIDSGYVDLKITRCFYSIGIEKISLQLSIIET